MTNELDVDRSGLENTMLFLRLVVNTERFARMSLMHKRTSNSLGLLWEPLEILIQILVNEF